MNQNTLYQVLTIQAVLLEFRGFWNTATIPDCWEILGLNECKKFRKNNFYDDDLLEDCGVTANGNVLS